MAITKATVRNDQLELQRRGFINVNLTALTTTAVPDVEVGSAFEVGGSIYEIDTADETPAGWAAISNDTQAYIYFDASAETLNFTDTAPSYSAAKGGWYSGDDRYLARVYKDASGNADNKEVYQQESPATADLIMRSFPWFTNRVVYDTAGNHTWTCPDNVYMVRVAIIGAGGGGGGAEAYNDLSSDNYAAAGAGGGSGSILIGYHRTVPGASYAVSVGAGGSGGAGTPTSGSDGGQSSFESLVASGGSGGGASELDFGGGDSNNITGSGGSGGANPNVQNCAAGTAGGDGETAADATATSGVGGDRSQLSEWPMRIDDPSGAGGSARSANGGANDQNNDGDPGNAWGGGGSGGAAADNGQSSDKADGGDGADGAVLIAY